MSCKKNKCVMIIIIRALSQWGKDDGGYDSPISRDATPDEIKIKRVAIKKGPNKKKWEKKREETMLLSFYHTCASK